MWLNKFRILFYSSIVIFCIAATALFIFGIQHQLVGSLFFLSFTLLTTTTISLWFILFHLQQREIIRQMKERSFQFYKSKALPAELREVCTRIELGFHNDRLKSAYTGKTDGRLTVVSNHRTYYLSEKNMSISSRWAIKSSISFPYAAIRPKSIFVDHERTLDHQQFDQQCSLSTKDIGVIRTLLLPMAEWFTTTNSDAKLMTKPRPISKKINWLIENQWVMIEIYGAHDEYRMIQMTEFLSAFVDQLEQISKHHNSKTVMTPTLNT